jgi:hypothetical protein
VQVREQMKAWKPNVNPYIQRFKELEALILAWSEPQPAASNLVWEGYSHLVPVSPRQNHRWIHNVMGFVRKVGGLKAYVELVPPTLALVERMVPKSDWGKYISEELTGRRTIGEPVQNQAVQDARAAA